MKIEYDYVALILILILFLFFLYYLPFSTYVNIMDHGSSSSPLSKLNGLTEDMSSLVKSLKVKD